MVNLIADCFPFLLYPSVDTHTSNALLLFFHIEMRLCYTQRSAVSKILWPHHVACGILFPWPGIDPVLPALEAWSLNHWTREVPAVFTMGILLESVSADLFSKTLQLIQRKIFWSPALRGGVAAGGISLVPGSLGWVEETRRWYLTD